MEEELQKEGQPDEEQAETPVLPEKDRVSELERALSEKEAEIARLTRTNGELEKKAIALGDSLTKAVASYRTAVVRANPEVIEELIAGDSIESVDDSLARGKELVDKVKRGVEAAISRTRVPAGAPERTPVDLSGMSAREKIQYAMGKK